MFDHNNEIIFYINQIMFYRHDISEIMIDRRQQIYVSNIIYNDHKFYDMQRCQNHSTTFDRRIFVDDMIKLDDKIQRFEEQLNKTHKKRKKIKKQLFLIK